MAAGITHLVASFIVPHLIKMNSHERAPTPSHSKHDTQYKIDIQVMVCKPLSITLCKEHSVCEGGGGLPINILAVVDHLQQLLLTNVLHHHHGADPEDI